MLFFWVYGFVDFVVVVVVGKAVVGRVVVGKVVVGKVVMGSYFLSLHVLGWYTCSFMLFGNSSVRFFRHHDLATYGHRFS